MKQMIHASGDDVERVIEAIEAHTAEFPREQVIMACLAFATWKMYPAIESEHLFASVGILSHHMCDYLAEHYPELTLPQDVPNNKLN